MNFKLSKLVTSISVLPAFVISLTNKAYALDTSNIPFENQDLPNVVLSLFKWAVGLAGVVFVVMFLVGGIQYLTSAGNEEASTKAKKLLVDAVIGILIVAIAWAAGAWILDQLGFTRILT